jgi:hypothetical protein
MFFPKAEQSDARTSSFSRLQNNEVMLVLSSQQPARSLLGKLVTRTSVEGRTETPGPGNEVRSHCVRQFRLPPKSTYAVKNPAIRPDELTTSL